MQRGNINKHNICACSPTPTLVGSCRIYLTSHLYIDVWELISDRSRPWENGIYDLTIKKQIGSAACPPPHLSSSRVAAQSGQLLAAILSKIMFLVKQPSVVCRVLNSDLCPHHDLLHDIESYPIFYDALYYPQYHLILRVFSTPENFCSWLQLCIRELCSACSPLFQTTSVVYDGLALCVRVDDIAMTFARFTFWIRYVFSLQHLQAFSGCFSSHCCIMSCVDEDPVWFSCQYDNYTSQPSCIVATWVDCCCASHCR